MLTRHLGNKSGRWKNTVEVECLEAKRDQQGEEADSSDPDIKREEDIEERVMRKRKAVTKDKKNTENGESKG